MKRITILALFAALLTTGLTAVFAADAQPVGEPLEETSHPVVKTITAAPVNLNWLSINGGGISYGFGGPLKVGYSIGQSVADIEGSGGGLKVGIGFWYGSTRVCAASKGDMNGVGGLSPADVVLMLNCVFLANGAGTIGGDCNICYADVNCSGDLSPADVVSELLATFNAVAFPCI